MNHSWYPAQISLCRRQSRSSAPSPGEVILIGGDLNDNNREVWERIIEAGGGRGKARFGILTAASIAPSQDRYADDPDQCSSSSCNGDYYHELLQHYGAASAEWIPVDLDSRSAAEDAELAARVRRCTGFFIGGGDQSRLSEVLQRGTDRSDTAVLAAVRAAVRDGAGIAGTSAGATIMQAGPMVTGGESYYAVRDGSRRGYSMNRNELMYDPDGGFGFFREGLVDTHFAYRGRQGRMIRLLSDTGYGMGYGIDENTALVASGKTLTVLGENNVHVFNMKDAETTSTRNWGIRTVRWSVLSSLDSFDVESGNIISGQEASRVDARDGSSDVRCWDVLSSPDHKNSDNARSRPCEMVNLAREFVSSENANVATGETYENDPTYRVSLSIGNSYEAWQYQNMRRISFQDIVVDIEDDDR